jgi:hypothetical protein
MSRGHTLVEVLIAAGIVGGIVVFATGTMDSLTSAGHEGRTQLQAVSGNQRALLFLANDLQSSSTDSDPDTGAPRYTIETGSAVRGLRSRRVVAAGEADGYERIGGQSPRAALPDELDTAAERVAASELGTGEHRARDTKAVVNSVLTFRKVVGYTIDPASGEVGPIWSSPITYSVNERRQLVRLENGQDHVVGRNVTVFEVRVDDLGNFIVTLVTEQHDRRSGKVSQVANRIEVHPKNS